MDNNLEDLDSTMEESCGSSGSTPRRHATKKLKRNDWSESRIIIPFVPLEAIKEEVTPCSSSQQLENNLFFIKNKLRSESRIAYLDQTEVSDSDLGTNSDKPLNSSESDNGDDEETNFNYTSSLQNHKNLHNIKSKSRVTMRMTGASIKQLYSSDSAPTTDRLGTKVNDTHISNIDSSRDVSDSEESQNETKSALANVYGGESVNIETSDSSRQKRKSMIHSHKNKASIRTSYTDEKYSNLTKNSIASVEDTNFANPDWDMVLNQTYTLNENETACDDKYKSCVKELKYYTLKHKLARKSLENDKKNRIIYDCEDEFDSNSELITNRTDFTETNMSVTSGGNEKINKENTDKLNTEHFSYTSSYSMSKDNAINVNRENINESNAERNGCNSLDISDISEYDTINRMHNNLIHNLKITTLATDCAQQNSPDILSNGYIHAQCKIIENPSNSCDKTHRKSKQENVTPIRRKSKTKCSQSENLTRTKSESKIVTEKSNSSNTKTCFLDSNNMETPVKKSRERSKYLTQSDSKLYHKQKHRNLNMYSPVQKVDMECNQVQKDTPTFRNMYHESTNRRFKQTIPNILVPKQEIVNSTKINNNKSLFDYNDTKDNGNQYCNQRSCLTNVPRKKVNNPSNSGRFSVGDDARVCHDRQDNIKSVGQSSGDHNAKNKKTTKDSTYINDEKCDNQIRQQSITPTVLRQNSSRNDSDCYSKFSDFSFKHSKSDSIKADCCAEVKRRLKVVVDKRPSTDVSVDCRETTVGSEASYIDNIAKQIVRGKKMMVDESTKLKEYIENDDLINVYSDIENISLDYCVECENVSDLSTQDSFIAEKQDNWTQVNYVDIIKETNFQSNHIGDIYTDFLRRKDAQNGGNKKRVRSGNTIRNENCDIKQRYRRGRELNFNYNGPIQNYLINSSRQHASRASHRDETVGCCGCIKLNYIRRLFNRRN